MKLIILCFCLVFVCGCVGFRHPPYMPAYTDEANWAPH